MEPDGQQARIGSTWRRHRVGSFVDRAAFETFAELYRRAGELLPPPSAVDSVPTSSGVARVHSFGPAGGTPLILLAGRNGCTPLWGDSIAAWVAAGYRVVAVDGIGEPGASVQAHRILTADGQTVWLTEMMRALNLERVHLLGAKLGGWLAVWTAVRRPDRIASITVIDPVPVFAPLTPALRAATLGTPVFGVSESARRSKLRQLSGFRPEPGSVADQLLDAGIAGFRTRFAAPVAPEPGDLAAVRTPLLVLLDPDSGVQNGHRAAQQAATIPAAEVATVPRAELDTELVRRVSEFHRRVG